MHYKRHLVAIPIYHQPVIYGKKSADLETPGICAERTND